MFKQKPLSTVEINDLISGKGIEGLPDPEVICSGIDLRKGCFSPANLKLSQTLHRFTH